MTNYVMLQGSPFELAATISDGSSAMGSGVPQVFVCIACRSDLVFVFGTLYYTHFLKS